MKYIRVILIVLVVVLAAVAQGFSRTAAQTGAALGLIIVSVPAVLLAVAAAFSRAKQRTYQQVFSPQKADTALSLLSAVCLAIGGVLQLMQGGLVWAGLGILCMLGAFGLAMGAIYRQRGKNPPARCYVPAVLFYALRLFRDFRHWMVDPAILDYCFLLFAVISFMLAAYHMGAFSFDRGDSRALTFFALSGVYFCAASTGFISLKADGFVFGGSALWLLACLLQMSGYMQAQKPAQSPAEEQ